MFFLSRFSINSVASFWTKSVKIWGRKTIFTHKILCFLLFLFWKFRCIFERTHYPVAVRFAERHSRARGFYRATFGRTRARSHSVASIVIVHSPIDRTCVRICKRIRKLKNIRAPHAVRHFHAWVYSPSISKSVVRAFKCHTIWICIRWSVKGIEMIRIEFHIIGFFPIRIFFLFNLRKTEKSCTYLTVRIVCPFVRTKQKHLLHKLTVCL